jgi:hypothetical protein
VDANLYILNDDIRNKPKDTKGRPTTQHKGLQNRIKGQLKAGNTNTSKALHKTLIKGG